MSTINKLIVKKSNDLMVARYSMTVNEQRLLLACISQIPLDIPQLDSFQMYKDGLISEDDLLRLLKKTD